MGYCSRAIGRDWGILTMYDCDEIPVFERRETLAYPEYSIEHMRALSRFIYVGGIKIEMIAMNVDERPTWMENHLTYQEFKPILFYERRVQIRCQIQVPRRDRLISRFGDEPDCMATTDYVYRLENVLDLLSGCSAQRLVILGNGYRCPSCGNYSPSGALSCWGCGDQMNLYPSLNPFKFPFTMGPAAQAGYDTFTEHVKPYGRFIEVFLEGPWEIEQENALDALTRGADLRLMPAGCNLDRDHYLCRYCGGTVRNGDRCPGCGGERMPLAELVRMDRACVYCGRDLKGGIVCSACGNRAAGTMIREVL